MFNNRACSMPAYQLSGCTEFAVPEETIMSDDQIEAAAPARARDDMGLEQLLESQRLERCPFPIPSSWFFVDFSENLAVGQVRNIQLFDQEWVLFRGESG